MDERSGCLFITLEGGDGAGKSVQAAALAKRLTDEGHTVVRIREPGGTPLGEHLREALLHAEAFDPLVETLLFFAARAQLISDVIRPALERGEVVISDRFTDSTRAYQGFGRGVSRDLIEQLSNALAAPEPDFKVLLDLPVEEGLGRANKVRTSDRFEREDIEFHQRVRKGYLVNANDDPAHWLILDATLPEEVVTERIYNRIGSLLAEKGQ